MNLSAEELLAAIEAGEGKTTEFKRGLPRPERAARTLVAFANTRGGLFLVGVGDRGELFGAPHPRKTLQELRELAARCVDPPLRVEVQVVDLGERSIVACSVPLSPQRPHVLVRANGATELVVRAGSSNRVADGATAKALREQRGSKRSLSELERRVLEWVTQLARGGGTVAGFCEAQNIGKQRARRAFVDLERAGLLVGHGTDARRIYHRV